MTALCLAFDPSSSLSKGLYAIGSGEMQWLSMEPEIIQISETAISQYRKRPFSCAQPENEAWVQVGHLSCAVGYLARERFRANPAVRVLKADRARYKVLAMVGAIAAQNHLPSHFDLELGILLPYGEYEDRTNLRRLLAEDLADFKFRGQQYQVRLSQFDCLPEGGGLLMRGLQPGNQGMQGLVIMVGYRNASYLLMDRGSFQRGETRDLGFVQMLERVMESTSGLTPLEMAGPICQAGKRVNRTPLKPLCRGQEGTLNNERLRRLITSVKAARKEYWQILSDWLNTCQFPLSQTVILSGGTAFYYQEELEKYFLQQGGQISWGNHLEERLQLLLGQSDALKFRLTDVCGYFYWLQYIFAANRLQQQAISA